MDTPSLGGWQKLLIWRAAYREVRNVATAVELLRRRQQPHLKYMMVRFRSRRKFDASTISWEPFTGRIWGEGTYALELHTGDIYLLQAAGDVRTPRLRWELLPRTAPPEYYQALAEAQTLHPTISLERARLTLN